MQLRHNNKTKKLHIEGETEEHEGEQAHKIDCDRKLIEIPFALPDVNVTNLKLTLYHCGNASIEIFVNNNRELQKKYKYRKYKEDEILIDPALLKTESNILKIALGQGNKKDKYWLSKIEVTCTGNKYFYC